MSNKFILANNALRTYLNQPESEREFGFFAKHFQANTGRARALHYAELLRHYEHSMDAQLLIWYAVLTHKGVVLRRKIAHAFGAAEHQYAADELANQIKFSMYLIDFQFKNLVTDLIKPLQEMIMKPSAVDQKTSELLIALIDKHVAVLTRNNYTILKSSSSSRLPKL